MCFEQTYAYMHAEMQAYIHNMNFFFAHFSTAFPDMLHMHMHMHMHIYIYIHTHTHTTRSGMQAYIYAYIYGFNTHFPTAFLMC